MAKEPLFRQRIPRNDFRDRLPGEDEEFAKSVVVLPPEHMPMTDAVELREYPDGTWGLFNFATGEELRCIGKEELPGGGVAYEFEKVEEE